VVITLAEAGKRDPDRLCNKALVAVGFLPRWQIGDCPRNLSISSLGYLVRCMSPLLAHSVTRTYSFLETSLKIEGEWP
jgi:hypothetical protein